MIKISELSPIALIVFSIPAFFSLLFLLQKNTDQDKKSFKTFIVSFSLFFVLSHILSYAAPLASYLSPITLHLKPLRSYLPYPAPYAIPYFISYLTLLAYLLITQKKNFNFAYLVIYFNFFIILQALLYMIIFEVRYNLGYDFPDKELNSFVSYLWVTAPLSYLFFAVGVLFDACSTIYQKITKIFK